MGVATLEILSVGIDIGTSTTQVVFSILQAENTAGYFSVPHVSITAKEVVYKGDIHTTPLKTQTLIDAPAVRELVAGDFAKAGYTPADTQTGAVIITGESARKENAAAVLENLSHFAGEFVVSTAGPDMEAIIAGKGSGAEQYSKDHNCRVANLDIGGGTTNIAVFDSGLIVAKGCLDIGGRLVRLDEESRVLWVSPPAALAAKTAGVYVTPGELLPAEAAKKLAGTMANLLEQQFGLAPETALLHNLQTGGSSFCPADTKPQVLFFSGGVADCVYHDQPNALVYGDLGVYLGRAIGQSRLMTAFRTEQPVETIRATVVGAGTYTTTISGSTIHFSPGIFPQKNIPVLRLSPQEECRCNDGDTQFLTQKLRWFLEQCDTELPVLAITGSHDPDYAQLTRLSQCLASAMDGVIPGNHPLLVVVENDIAKALGQLMGRRITEGRRLAVIDSVHLEQGDFLDFGNPIMNGTAIPVVVKTLIFG